VSGAGQIGQTDIHQVQGMSKGSATCFRNSTDKPKLNIIPDIGPNHCIPMKIITIGIPDLAPDCSPLVKIRLDFKINMPMGSRKDI